MATVKMFRFTIPSLYPAGTLGHTDPSARQGYYVPALTPEEGQRNLANSELYSLPANVSIEDLELDPSHDQNWGDI
jgi:hypothetical protein